MVGANTNQANQNSSAGQKSLKDRIDYDKLGDYAPENEVEETMLDNALNSLEQAMDLNQEYIESLRNPYDDTREMIKEYKELYEETGHAMDPELFADMWPQKDTPEFLKSTRDLYLDMAESSIETYIELKEEDDLEDIYGESLDIEDFLEEEDSDKAEKAETVQDQGIQDMVDQFLNNPANKN